MESFYSSKFAMLQNNPANVSGAKPEGEGIKMLSQEEIMKMTKMGKEWRK